MKIREGDTVKVLYGKDSGKTGKVLKVDYSSSKAVVEGVNIFRKHIKGDGQSRKSEVVSITKAMPISKLMLIDPATGKSTRVGYQVKAGKKTRIAKVNGKAVDIEQKSGKSEEESEKKAKPKAKKKSAKKTTKKKTTKKKATTSKSKSKSKTSSKK